MNDKKSNFNSIYLTDKDGKRRKVEKIEGLEVDWRGENNIIEIGESPAPIFVNSKITCASDCCIRIGSSNNCIKNLEVFALSSGAQLLIGNNFSIGDGTIILKRS